MKLAHKGWLLAAIAVTLAACGGGAGTAALDDARPDGHLRSGEPRYAR